ncbi:hypothetical protein CDO87_14190 [Sagittula sp. P11]|uniref:hypothetical protein n=1 Tax=Sagittula sp. P11 TaxID=2009329 RepID=UPI000C2D2CE2|nr:hypothetical protein [Sagittula sp. P11]AUC54254.1 hypothetical protein CDO87_14190 [Sagittula sp. P11]
MRTDDQISAIVLVGDMNWRRGPKWRAALAWAFGRRELITTALGDVLDVRWFQDEPFLLNITEIEDLRT